MKFSVCGDKRKTWSGENTIFLLNAIKILSNDEFLKFVSFAATGPFPKTAEDVSHFAVTVIFTDFFPHLNTGLLL